MVDRYKQLAPLHSNTPGTTGQLVKIVGELLLAYLE